MILNQLPLAAKHDVANTADVNLPQITLPNGEILPATKLRFTRIQTQDMKGTLKWRWAYAGPIPYCDEEIIIEKKDKTDLKPIIETERILLP